MRTGIVMSQRSLLPSETMKYLTPMILVLLALACTIPPVHAQFDCTISDGKVTITGYSGSGGEVVIPDTIEGLPITSIGYGAFYQKGLVTSVTIPNSVISIETEAFRSCTSLTSVTIGNSVTTIGDGAFGACGGLGAVYFQGDLSPLVDRDIFDENGCHIYPYHACVNATVYYLPGTAGWERTFLNFRTAPWVRPDPVILDFGPSFGVGANGFGFRISWATNADVVVEAATDPASPIWSPVATNSLVDGWSDFTDPDLTSSLPRFYRLRSP